MHWYSGDREASMIHHSCQVFQWLFVQVLRNSP